MMTFGPISLQVAACVMIAAGGIARVDDVTPASAPVPASAQAASPPVPVSPAAEPSVVPVPAASTTANGAALSDTVAAAIRRMSQRKAAMTGQSTDKDSAVPVDPKAHGISRDMVFTAGGEAFSDPSTNSPKPTGTFKQGVDFSQGAPEQWNRPGRKPALPTAKEVQDPETTPALDALDAKPEDVAKLAAPGRNHTLLELFVGTWDVRARFPGPDGSMTDVSTGQMTGSWQLDGRWIRQEFAGDLANLGQFRGIGYFGFDNAKRQYVTTWMDTLSTGVLVSQGRFNTRNATFDLIGQFTGPSGANFTQRQELRVISPDKFEVSMFLTGPDGQEMNTGVIEYSRSLRKIETLNTTSVDVPAVGNSQW